MCVIVILACAGRGNYSNYVYVAYRLFKLGGCPREVSVSLLIGSRSGHHSDVCTSIGLLQRDTRVSVCPCDIHVVTFVGGVYVVAVILTVYGVFPYSLTMR